MLSLVLVVHKSMKVTRIYWRKNYTTRDFGMFNFCLKQLIPANHIVIWTLMNHQWYQGIMLCFVKYQQLTRWSEHNYVSFWCCLSVRRKEGTANPVHSVHLGPSYRISISEKLSNTKQSFKSRGDESKSDVGVAHKIT